MFITKNDCVLLPLGFAASERCRRRFFSRFWKYISFGAHFINKDNHFFVEGDKQLGFLFNDFISQRIDVSQIDNIINSLMVYALNFDLQTPNFNDVKEVFVHQILDMNNNQKIKTAKRVGYKFSFETNNE